MKAFDDLGSRIAFDSSRNVLVARSPSDIDPHSHKFSKAMLPVRNTTLWLSIEDLLNRSWFERLWIWQEVCLAKNDISLVCGNIEIGFQTFCNAIRYLFGGRSGFSGLGQARLIVSQFSRKGSKNFSQLMYDMRHCKCSDERDRVYGLLNLTHEHDQLQKLPDYTKSVREVFQALLMRQLRDRRSLDLLMLGSLSTASLDIPTWLNWSVPTEIRGLRSGEAAAGAWAVGHYAGDGILETTGLYVATICQVRLENGIWSNEVSRSTAREAIENVLRKVIGSVHIAVARPMIESLCRSMRFHLCSEDYFPPREDQTSFQEAFNSFEECWKSSSIQDPKSAPKWRTEGLLTACKMMRGRVIITTANGLTGIGPEDARVGDKICVILGCANPLVLRPREDQHYQIVGECCFDGIMEGEALLGPLPSPWRPIKKWYPELKEYYSAYLDPDTGKTQIEDPRLGSLPKGWSIKSHKDQDAWSCYINYDTGEDAGSEHPGLRFDALEKRGVKFEEFRLV